MKLRIKGNSIRLRLTQSEIQEFQEKGIVKEVIKFGNLPLQKMNYILQQFDGNEMNASYESNTMIVNVPNSIAATWVTTNQVGVENRIKINNEEDLFILIEKDFQCLKPRDGEDESEMFPNPSEETLKC